MKATVVFDLDGTLVEASPHEAYERHDLTVLSQAAPIGRVVEFASRLLRQQCRVVVATSRPVRVREATLACLKRCGLETAPLFDRTQDAFDLASAVQEKARVIREVGASLIVGDRDDLEGAAARAAGIAFLHVKEIRGVSS